MPDVNPVVGVALGIVSIGGAFAGWILSARAVERLVWPVRQPSRSIGRTLLSALLALVVIRLTYSLVAMAVMSIARR
jgi:hypothetical protein